MRRRRRKQALFALAVALAVGSVAGAMMLASPGGGALNRSLHQHPNIEIYIQGSQVPMPANIGIDASLWKDHSMDEYNQMAGMSAMSPLHTHEDASAGTIHLEMNQWHLCTIGDLFDVWGQPFDRGEILTQRGPVTVTVDGQPNDQFRDLPLQDGQRIVIRG